MHYSASIERPRHPSEGDSVIQATLLLLFCSLAACTTMLPHTAATQNAWISTSGDGGGGGGGGGGAGNGM
jgi:hypothetical protein